MWALLNYLINAELVVLMEVLDGAVLERRTF